MDLPFAMRTAGARIPLHALREALAAGAVG